MSARQLLDQLLQSGQGLLSDASTKVQGATGGKGSFLTGLGGGALGAGALGLPVSYTHLTLPTILLV